MNKVMFIADIHLSAVPPSSRTDDYAETIFKKLYQCTAMVKKFEIDAVVILGDTFHLKSWRANPYWMTNRLVDWLKSLRDAGARVFLLVGNHDVPFGRVDLAPQQPIGVLRALDFVETEGVLEDPSVRIVLRDFDPNFTVDLINVKKKGEQYLIVGIHQCLMPKGQFFDEPTVNFSEVTTEADVVAYGHIHAPTVISRCNDILFVNPGALSRGSLHRDNLERPVNVILMRFGAKIEHAAVALNVVPAVDVFDVEKHEKSKLRDGEIAKFVDMMGRVISEGSSTDPYTVLESIKAPQEIKDLARSYLDGDSALVGE